MTEWLSTIRPYLEAAYFCAGVLVLLGLLLASRQLNLLRLDINLRNERAAKEKAILACERYLGEFVRLSGEATKERSAKTLPVYRGPIGDFSADSIPLMKREAALKSLVLESVLPELNELEAIAASFRTGVADEKTGFQIIGRSFCSTVERSYDVIASCRDDDVHGYWSGIVEVYSIWRPRLSKAEMEFERNRLQKKIDTLSDLRVRPIGEIS
jgi:hypothetical protein